MVSDRMFDVSNERWVEIFDFPGYSVSDQGRVLNNRTGFYIKATKKPQGLCVVGLMKNGVQHKRSLPLLVASAFVSRHRNEAFDTPVNLNGDRNDNCYKNLVWRPVWFARKYAAQFSDGHPSVHNRIEDVETGEIYSNSMEASVVNGVLDIDIYLSMINNTYVFPTGQVFREVVES